MTVSVRGPAFRVGLLGDRRKEATSASGGAIRLHERSGWRMGAIGALAAIAVIAILLVPSVRSTGRADRYARDALGMRHGKAIVHELPTVGPHGPRQVPKVGRIALDTVVSLSMR